MDNGKKQGSILIRNLFFVVIIFMLSLSISRLQNLNLNSVRSSLMTKKIINYIDVIKNELYFNSQYLHIKDGVYINEKNINSKNYKFFKDTFENNYQDYENYFYLELESPNVINISYFYKQKLFLNETFEI